MGISTSQAEALAEGFLDTLGSGMEGLRPKDTLSELFLIAGELIEDAQDNLNKSNSNASGELSESLVLSDPRQDGSVISVDVVMNFYGEFINSGVKGTRSGTGKYRFKTEFPSLEMVQALVKGIRRAKQSSFNVNKSKSVSKNEVKNKTISEIDKAYGAGRNIKMYGIKATGFFDKAVSNAERKFADRLGAALQIDLLNSL